MIGQIGFRNLFLKSNRGLSIEQVEKQVASPLKRERETKVKKIIVQLEGEIGWLT
jgi:hypothetical protein